jgi:chorismate mutase
MSIFLRAIPLLLLLSGCASQPGASFAPTPAETRVVELMGRRLAIANEVAWIKYRNQLPVRDATREAEILDRLAILASQGGADAAATRSFFAAQIRASRAQQEDDIRRWSAGATLPIQPPQSLRDDIRPKIDAIDRALIAALAQRDRPRAALADFAAATFRREGFCRSASHLAAAPLR